MSAIASCSQLYDFNISLNAIIHIPVVQIHDSEEALFFGLVTRNSRTLKIYLLILWKYSFIYVGWIFSAQFVLPGRDHIFFKLTFSRLSLPVCLSVLISNKSHWVKCVWVTEGPRTSVGVLNASFSFKKGPGAVRASLGDLQRAAENGNEHPLWQFLSHSHRHTQTFTHVCAHAYTCMHGSTV